jgi:hypothetical protein
MNTLTKRITHIMPQTAQTDARVRDARTGHLSRRLEDEHEDRSCEGGSRQQPGQGMERRAGRSWLAAAHRLIDGDPAASRGNVLRPSRCREAHATKVRPALDPGRNTSHPWSQRWRCCTRPPTADKGPAAAADNQTSPVDTEHHPRRQERHG